MAGALHNRDIAFDTSVLVPLVRAVSGTSTSEERRTGQSYNESELAEIDRMVGAARSCRMLPYVLAETSNLVSQKAGKQTRREAVQRIVQDWLEGEVKIESVAKSDDFSEFGATDVALLIWLRADEKRTVITEDARLWARAAYEGLSIVNFSHFREATA